VDVFQALADPTRRSIVALLAPGERAAGEIVSEFSISPPAVSQHLKALKSAGLVQVRVEAQRRIYALDPRGLDDLRQWIARVDRFWNERLDALERELRAEAKKDKRRKTK